MDFFEAQARAKKRTAKLVTLFVLAVLGTIAAGYFASIVAFYQLRPRADELERSYWRYQQSGLWADANTTTTWWHPRLLGLISIGTLAVVGIASLVKWSQYSHGGGAVAESVGGRRVDPRTTDLNERRLLNVVEEMAIASGTPVPEVYVLEDEVGINAFAAGLTTNDAAVAVTRGAVDKLTRDELQGVIGHEFSHILNGDMRLNVRIAATVFGILVIGLAGRAVLWSLRHTRVRHSRKNSGGLVAAVVAIGLIMLIVGYVGYFFGRLIQAAVSRQREFLADASAVQFTRNPTAVTGALKKIGGYALGSSLQTSKAAAIGHFFFAQAFRSGFTGLWSTHPPLDERIRAIEPQFDGKMFDPPKLVDIERESFREAGFGSGQRRADAAALAFAATPLVSPSRAPAKIPFQPKAAVAAIGTLTPAKIGEAQQLLDSLPARLRAAAHAPPEATALLCTLLLADDPALRAQQRTLIAKNLGPEIHRVSAELEPDVQRLGAREKLPLVQIAVVTLRQIPPNELATFLGTLDDLVHADEQVSVFEFGLQKLVAHSLQLGRHPQGARAQIHSFRAVEREIAVLISALARTATNDEENARRAFNVGASEFASVLENLRMLDPAAANLAALDTALDKLATATLPIKQRTLLAAAQVVGADDQIHVAEAELLRAISAALDCPMPLLSA